MKDPLQKQYEEGYPVEKPVRHTAQGWKYVEEYGEIFGMTPAQAATYLLQNAIREAINEGLITPKRRKRKKEAETQH